MTALIITASVLQVQMMALLLRERKSQLAKLTLTIYFHFNKPSLQRMHQTSKHLLHEFAKKKHYYINMILIQTSFNVNIFL